MSKLLLIRHGMSEWNKLGLWTGWTDIELAPEGIEEAKKTASAIKDAHVDYAFVSDLKRAQQTFKTINDELGYEIPFTIAPEVKERNYGDLTGKNKWDIKEQYGEEQFMKWRRGWDDEVPGGENLKQVYERVMPYYFDKILPLIKEGKNVMVCAHGNSLRALAKYLENVADADVHTVEINTGEAFIYELDSEGKMLTKEVRANNEKKV